MTVQEIIVHLLAGRKGQDPFNKFRQVVPYLVLGVRRCRAGMQVNDPCPRPKGHHRRLPGILAAGIDIDRNTLLAQEATEFSDIDVHATRLTSSQRRQRTAMHAEHGDPAQRLAWCEVRHS